MYNIIFELRDLISFFKTIIKYDKLKIYNYMNANSVTMQSE